MLTTLIIVGVLLILFWLSTAAFLFGREVYIHMKELQGKRYQLAAEKHQITAKNSTARLLVDAEVKRRDSFRPPEPTDKPLFDRVA